MSRSTQARTCWSEKWGIVKDGDADRLSGCLAIMPGKQVVTPIAIESKLPRKGSAYRAVPQTTGKNGLTRKILELPDTAEAQCFVFRRSARILV